MFQLTRQEQQSLRRQFGTLRWGGHTKYLPYAFTQVGVAMLSSVPRSPRAFVRLRETLFLNRELAQKLAELERKIEGHDTHIPSLFEAMRQLMAPPPAHRKPVGFHVRERPAKYGKR
jgi:hypothetical protein